MYSLFDKTRGLLPKNLTGTAPPSKPTPVCTDNASFKFSPAFGPFEFDDCGEKLVRGRVWFGVWYEMPDRQACLLR